MRLDAILCCLDAVPLFYSTVGRYSGDETKPASQRAPFIGSLPFNEVEPRNASVRSYSRRCAIEFNGWRRPLAADVIDLVMRSVKILPSFEAQYDTERTIFTTKRCPMLTGRETGNFTEFY